MIGRILKQAVLLGAWLALPAMAHADPVTYAGKLGNIDIVVEFTADPATAKEPVAGRYFYRSKGVDIPLQAKSKKGAALQLAEEEACDAKKCGDGQAPTIAAVWRLSSADKGKTLEGTWTAKKSLPLKLTRIASRAQTQTPAKTPYDLHDFTDATFSGDDAPITMAASPYDYLRLDFAPKAADKAGWPDAAYDYVTDPRTKFARPRVVDLSGGAPIEAANALLQNRHWHDSLSALNCAALRYAGFHDGPIIEGMDDGSLGGYEDSTSEVTSLTPKLMSWRESGSLYCGGAHPENYSDAYVMDARRGALLGLQDMFSDTADSKPGASLLAFVKEKRPKPSDQTEVDFEAECGTDDLINDYLGVSLKRDGDRQMLVFGLQGLPHVIQACGDDLIEIPASDAKALFTPEFEKLLEP
jgi:hypothetical protein